MDDSFTKTTSTTCDRFIFLSSKQQKGESVENFYGRLREQAENCCPGDEETRLIRDTFIPNMLDHETQKEVPKETLSSTNCHKIAIHTKMRAQNQQKFN